MPIRFKTSGGGWTAPIANGKIRLKWGGSTWQTPSVIYRKMGDVGGGYWLDTGYRGGPGAPSTPWVHSWPGYSEITIAWAGSTVGAAAASYDALQMDSSGNWLTAEWGGTDGYSTFATTPGQYYIYCVRATSESGLVSGWSGYLRTRMGYSGQPIYGYTMRTELWYQQINGEWGRDNPAWITVPNHVTIQKYHYFFDCPAGQGITSPAPNRTLHRIFYSTTNGDVMYLPSPVYYIENLPSSYGHIAIPAPPSVNQWEHGIWGGGHLWGVVPRGSGWGWIGHPDGNYHNLNGSFGVEGTAHFDDYSVVGYTADTPNGYW